MTIISSCLVLLGLYTYNTYFLITHANSFDFRYPFPPHYSRKECKWRKKSNSNISFLLLCCTVGDIGLKSVISSHYLTLWRPKTGPLLDDEKTIHAFITSHLVYLLQSVCTHLAQTGPQVCSETFKQTKIF